MTYDLSLDNCFTSFFFFIQCTDTRVCLSSFFNLTPSSSSRNSLIVTRLADQKYPTKPHTQNTWNSAITTKETQLLAFPTKKKKYTTLNEIIASKRTRLLFTTQSRRSRRARRWHGSVRIKRLLTPSALHNCVIPKEARRVSRVAAKPRNEQFSARGDRRASAFCSRSTATAANRNEHLVPRDASQEKRRK